MPDPTALLDATTLDPEASIRTLAAATGLPKSTVHEALKRFEPVRELLGQVKRDASVVAWQQIEFKALAAMDQFLDGEEPIAVGAKSSVSAEIRNLAVAAGIASEKALLFAGQPTQITQVTTDLRASLPGLLERLGRIGRTRVEALGPGGPAHEAAEMDDRALTPEETR